MHPRAPPTTPGRSVYDESRFDVDELLSASDSDDLAALLDEAEPSYLADQTAVTLVARTPARARATARVEDESMLQDGTMAHDQDGDSEAAHDDLLADMSDDQLETQPHQAALSPSPTPEPAPALDQPPSSPRSFSAPLAVEPSPPRDLHAPSSSSAARHEALRIEASPAPSAEALPMHVAPLSPSPSVPREVGLDPAPPASNADDSVRARAMSDTPVPSSPAPPPARQRTSLGHLSAGAPRPLALHDLVDTMPEPDVAGPSHDLPNIVEETEDVSASRSFVGEPAEQLRPAPAAVAVRADAAPLRIAAPVEPEPAPAAPRLVEKRSSPPLPPVAPAARTSLAPASRPPRPIASSSTLPPPVQQPHKKRSAAEKGVHDVDEEAKRRVREAKAARERAALERTQRLEREAAARKTAQRREGGAAQDKVEAARAEKAATAAAHGPPPAPASAPAPAPAPAPSSTRTSLERSERVGDALHDDSPLPVFAFDGDSSLPAMGAPLELVRDEREDGALGLGVEAAQMQGITSTPARPAKRKAGDELVAEEVVDQVERRHEVESRRATLAVPSVPGPHHVAHVEHVPEEVKMEEHAEDGQPESAPVAQVKPRGRASRASLVAATSINLVASSSSASARRPAARPSMGKAIRVVLVAPAPAEPVVGPDAGRALLATSTSSSSGMLSRSQRRASRVPAEPPTAGSAPAVAQPPALGASASSRRAGRISTAPPPPTPPGKHAEAMLAVESTRAEQTVSLSASGSGPLKASTRRASRVFTVVEEQVTAQQLAHGATTSALSASVPSAPLKHSHGPSTSRPRSASASHPHRPPVVAAHVHTYVEPPRVPPPPGKVIGGVTLPASFSFAADEHAAAREAERLHRVEEKERRERLAQEVVEERKRKRDEMGSWAVPGVGAATQEGEGIKRQRLADPLARSTSSTAPPTHPAPPHLAAASPLGVDSHLTLGPTAERSQLRSSSPAARLAVEPAARPSAHGPPLEPEPVALTREALERNTRRAGPRVELERRVSMWALEGVLEDVEEEMEEVQEEAAVVVAAEPVAQQGQALQEQEVILEQEMVFEQEQKQLEQPVQIEQLAMVPVAPVLPPTSPVVAAAAEPAPAPAAAPPAPPFFEAQLGAWQARERSSLGGGAHGAARVPAPAPAPAAAAAPGTRVRRALEPPAPARPGPTKRARVATSSASGPAPKAKGAPAPAGPRRAPIAVQQAKENAPVVGSSAAAATAATATAPKTGVAAELEKQRQQRADWSERQKQREEEVKRRREDERKREAEQEREKLVQLRASLARGGPAAAKGGARRAGRV